LTPVSQQVQLFFEEESERDTRLIETVDRLRDRFGEGSLVSGKSIEGNI
jgi:hypothetical protein